MIKNKKGVSLLEQTFIIAILGILMTYGFGASMSFYENVQEKSVSNDIRYIVENVINANDVGRGINEDRIKKNIITIENNSGVLHNYYYTEVFELDPITNVVSSIPKTEFYGMEIVDIPDGITFSFPDEIEGISLTENINDDNTLKIGIERIKPNNELMVFDAHPDFFQNIENDEMIAFRSDFTYGKGYKDLIRGEPLNNTIYYDISKSLIPPNFTELEIDVIYNQKIIGYIVLDTNMNKITYVDRRSENIGN